jgi:hypothetical protein
VNVEVAILKCNALMAASNAEQTARIHSCLCGPQNGEDAIRYHSARHAMLVANAVVML